jgi:hypothetical protein
MLTAPIDDDDDDDENDDDKGRKTVQNLRAKK